MCGRKRDDGIDVAVLVAARDLVVAHGYSSFSVEGVAARLGIAKSTVYKRWPSRQQLLAVALSEYLRSVPVVADHHLNGDFHANLVVVVANEMQLAGSPQGRAIAQAVFEGTYDDGDGKNLLRLAMTSRRAALVNILSAALDTAALPSTTDVSLVADVLFSACWGSAVAGLALDETKAEKVVDAVLPRALV